MRRSRLTALVLLAMLVAGACGSRASKSQVAEALRTGAGGSGASAGSQDATASDSGVLGGSAGQAATAGVAGGISGGGSSARSSSATTLPPGGNGGATDVGVTGNSITVANISILTGPVPGLFAGAVNGTDAFLQYQNSQGGVYGRQLKLLAGDDQFDCGQNRALTEADLTKAFAFVGSFSLFDNCGAQVINANPTVPDVHNALALDAQNEPNNFSSQPIRQGSATGALTYFKSKAPGGIQHAASLIGDVQSAKDSWAGTKHAAETLGYKFDYERVFEPTEQDFTPDIVQMKNQGVKVLFLLAVDVKSAARILGDACNQGWHPELSALGASAYDPQLIPLAESACPGATEGVYLYLPSAMYLGEDRATNKEVDLFLTWLKKTHPSANADLFTVYGWTAARLFVQALQTAGPKATRTGLIAALRNVHQFDANGMLPTADPAGKKPPICYITVRIHGGQFARLDDPPNGFRCDGTYVYLNQ